jgi:hypothetical protein
MPGKQNFTPHYFYRLCQTFDLVNRGDLLQMLSTRGCSHKFLRAIGQTFTGTLIEMTPVSQQVKSHMTWKMPHIHKSAAFSSKNYDVQREVCVLLECARTLMNANESKSLVHAKVLHEITIYKLSSDNVNFIVTFFTLNIY